MFIDASQHDQIDKGALMHSIVARPVGNEPDLLAGRENCSLIFSTLDNEDFMTIPAPPGGWTHDLLESKADSLSEQIHKEGWDAYLLMSGQKEWIGSSEV